MKTLPSLMLSNLYIWTSCARYHHLPRTPNVGDSIVLPIIRTRAILTVRLVEYGSHRFATHVPMSDKHIQSYRQTSGEVGKTWIRQETINTS
ncbi:hypothetical protein L484_009495 [Morus notabilis]|uniref:Uncharacterized protein n=1 Tax=Morus notabilis TaxID=981085 RepID=W9QPG2_9ROSA|nr:hypothetical protein L484_009495 [Morus notabilis]